MIAALRRLRVPSIPAHRLWLGAYAILLPLLLRGFIPGDSAAFWTGTITCIVLAGRPANGTTSRRFGWLALAMALLYFPAPVTTARYAALAAGGLFILESRRGRQDFLIPLSLFIMSPVFGNLSSTFAFPLRLHLTKTAGALLHATGQDVTASGNLIRSGGADFSVDPACMGLHMLQCALLCCIMMTAVYRQRYARRLPAMPTLLILILCLALTVLSNLLRILVLVQFRIMPETAMHEIAGLLCLALYVLVPCAMLIRWMTRRFGKAEAELKPLPLRNGGLLHAAILLSLGIGLLMNPPKPGAAVALPQIPGYRVSQAEAGVIRLNQGTAVIYLKDLQSFYGTEHHPMLCWTGSGFRFRQVFEDRICGIPLMRGVLERDGQRYLSAWWYSAGAGHTYSGAAWRWDALRNGRQYSIVNVTATDEAGLRQQIARLASMPELERWLRREGR
jgi:exosortase N